MKTLKLNSRGQLVQKLQQDLTELGFDPGAFDGVFGRRTERAVMAFQLARGLMADGIVGAQTQGALSRALKPAGGLTNYAVPKLSFDPDSNMESLLLCRFDEFVRMMAHPVVYGPGRGLFHRGQWMVTWGPGKVGAKGWAARVGYSSGPSLHCSSLTNLLAGFLLNYNERWTHAGNRPLLENLATSTSSLHPQPRGGGARWRGYGEHMERLASDGDTAERLKLRLKRSGRFLDAKEIWRRRKELAAINFFSQGDKKNGRWNTDHHTGVLVYIREEDCLYRLAADGWRSKKAPRRYSAHPVSFKRLPTSWAKTEKNRIYQVFRLVPDASVADMSATASRQIIVES